MREIKFRAWNSTNKKMLSPLEIYRDLHYQFQIDCFGGIGLTYADSQDINCNFELMQYTGLKDKNGEEIYEGDILLAKYAGLEDAYCEVIFKDGLFIALEKGCKYPDLLIDIAKDSKVIGCKYSV